MITQQTHSFKRAIIFFKVPPALFLILMSACDPDLSDNPIPVAAFADITINITLPEYQALSSIDGHAYVNDPTAGVRGIIVYRKSSSAFLAFERNCSFQPEDACATVDAQAFDMKDSCCGSIFSYADGRPTNGPAWRPLRQYVTSFSGNTLTITDTIL